MNSAIGWLILCDEVKTSVLQNPQGVAHLARSTSYETIGLKLSLPFRWKTQSSEKKERKKKRKKKEDSACSDLFTIKLKDKKQKVLLLQVT